MKKALISVYDKTGIVEFAKELENLGYGIISTGGTYKKLIDNNNHYQISKAFRTKQKKETSSYEK